MPSHLPFGRLLPQPVDHVIVHQTPDPLTKTETLPLPPQVKTDQPQGPTTVVETTTVIQGPTVAPEPPVEVTPRWKAFPDANTPRRDRAIS